ncbi:cholecystokinin receptor type A [Poecilia formosa]|uniref:Gastrin/cholecystokinin type B receptor n=1 Tax=Poecilia formosa TaxID=48698 RepID=A0A087Y1S0_POEFO|nr:PREDICTED: cholecystokinin receptor type A [Poecilia formosa]XP_016526553.1 PREDICTED: cholecystokinin receptor type A [Poecilia formosa]
METITTYNFLINSTDLNNVFSRFGINISDYEPRRGPSPDSKDNSQPVRIILYSIIFLLSLIGNSIIIIVLLPVGRRQWQKTITNLFLLSLAVSDLLVSLVCIPFTLIPNVMKDFIFGLGMCKMVMYFMGVSVSVSTFNLVAISIERYYAICSPLASMTWQTKSHAKKVITSTWVVSSILMLPYPISSTLIPFTRPDNSTGHMCRLIWPNAVFEQSWYIALLLVLFLIPGIMMATAYGRISLKLYKGIKRAQSLKSSSSERHASTGSVKPANGNGCNSSESKRTRRNRSGELPETSRNPSQKELVANKRVIHMLIVIVVLFFLCWTPIYVVNAWKAFDKNSANRLTGAPISFIHLLSYTSSCVNPIVYCFMNKRFRRAIAATFCNFKILWRIRKWFYYGKKKRTSVWHKHGERRWTLSSGMNIYSQSMRESTPCVNANIPMTQCSEVP